MPYPIFGISEIKKKPFFSNIEFKITKIWLYLFYHQNPSFGMIEFDKIHYVQILNLENWVRKNSITIISKNKKIPYIGLNKNKLNNIEKRIVLIEFDKIKLFFIGFLKILFHVKTIRIVNDYIYNHSRIFYTLQFYLHSKHTITFRWTHT